MATLALALVALGPARGRAAWRLVLAWNVFGIVDILFVVATAARLFLADPGSLRELVVLPLSLLPTWLVPLVIASHVVIFSRLRSLRGPTFAMKPAEAAR